ncbi:MAG: universal stress protein [Phycisphaeraceae bacterium]
MFKHVLAAVDFSSAWPNLKARLEMLHQLGTQRVTLVHVLAMGYPIAPAETHREHYEAKLGQLASEFTAAGMKVDSRVLTGEPGYELTQAAIELRAGLILAGMRGYSVVHDFFLGSTALNIARLTEIPLWLEPVNKAPETRQLETILLATDASAAAAHAEDLFIAFAKKATSAIALQVISEREQEAQARDAQQHLETLTHRAANIDVRMQAGDPATLITETADNANADVIVVGKRGQSALRGLLLGSTAETVARRSDRPVLIVPAAEQVAT